MKEFLIGAAALAAMGPVLAQTTAPAVPPASRAPMAAPAPRAMPERVQTRDQVVQKVREHFARLDTNRDGFLTREEAEAGRAEMRERVANRLRERAQRAPGAARDPNAAFDRLDTNRDGMISREEFAQGREARIERRADRAAKGPRGMRGGGMAGLGSRMFDMADANRDGRVSLQEATDAAVRRFDMADANRDGQVTREERRQMRRQMMESRRAPTDS